MLNALWWLLAVEAIGLAAFPIAHYLFPRLPDRGFSVSKPLGILLIGYVSWVSSLSHALPNVRLFLTALLLALATLSAWYGWRRRHEILELVRRERRVLVTTELVFLGVFLAWTLFRSLDPAINHTEQPMDFAFLNASMATRSGPPEDPWYRGEPISYYYFGYWMMGAVAKVAAVPPAYAYNLALALVPAMAASGIFGLVYAMVRAGPRQHRIATVSGLGAVILLGAAANLEGVLEFMRANGMGSRAFWDWLRIDGLDGPSPVMAAGWAPEEFWWWFRATRVINTFQGDVGLDFTIQEFPFFSFMLGDLHPHVMSLPFALLFLTLTWSFLGAPGMTWRRGDIRGYWLIGALGLALGGLAFTNMWDLPTYATVFVAVAALKAYRSSEGGRRVAVETALTGGAVLLIAFVLFSPYFLAFRAGVNGIGAVGVTTRPAHLLIVWGLLLTATLPFLLAAFARAMRGRGRLPTAVYAAMLLVLPFLAWAFLHLENGGSTADVQDRVLRVLPLALVAGVALYGAIGWSSRRGEPGEAFAVALGAIGMVLIMGPELLFVDDQFRSRMNTMFKLYYQAWLLLAVVSGFAIYYWNGLRTAVQPWRRGLAALWAVVFVVLLAGSLYYPPAAAVSKAERTAGNATLNGLAGVDPAELEAITHIRGMLPEGAGMVEAVGEWFDAGLISRSTGVPTVVNWPGHEVQWRGNAEGLGQRQLDVARIYETHDVEEARNLLGKYDVNYVYVGPREVATYGREGLDKFSTFMEVEFSQGGATLYRLP